MRCAGPVDVDLLSADIADHQTRLGLARPDVTVRCVDELTRQGTGKLKRFVPLVSSR